MHQQGVDIGVQMGVLDGALTVTFDPSRHTDHLGDARAGRDSKTRAPSPALTSPIAPGPITNLGKTKRGIDAKGSPLQRTPTLRTY